MSGERRWPLIAGSLAAASGLAIAVPKLALFVAVATLLAFLSMPQLGASVTRTARGLFALAATFSAVAVLRFVVVDAVPSLVSAGNNAQSFNAVTRLREILLAEDAMRKGAFVDPDADGIGSAGLLGELRGTLPLRGGAPLAAALLNETYSHVEETPIGPAALVSGYYVIVCLPRRGGGFTARPSDAIDDEAAERRFVAYAWPQAAKFGPQEAFFIDEHDRILVSANRSGTEPRYASTGFPPPCYAALAASTSGDWSAWRGKRPRASLPGDG
jgi:hypothetical protein